MERPNQIAAALARPGRLLGGALLCAVVLAGVAMTALRPATADQRLRPVVVLECAGSPRLCQALVQAMSAAAPGPIFRINPDPAPPRAVTVRVEMGPDNSARLHFPGGPGDFARRGSHNDAEFARHIVTKASPALAQALNGT